MNKHSKNSPGRKIGYLLIAIIVFAPLIALSAMLFINSRDSGQSTPQTSSEPVSEPQPSEAAEPSRPAEPVEPAEPEPDEISYPVGKLFVSDGREAYVSGDMVLEIPRLGLTCPVLNGTDEATLINGAGLFEYAQLPGAANSNTSIAAHRDIHGKEFYYIDTITDGDLMYLTYEGKKYTYEHMETFITHDSDWSAIRVRDFSCITLQSCDPIGTSLNRIFVVGRLIAVEDAQPAAQEEQ